MTDMELQATRPPTRLTRAILAFTIPILAVFGLMSLILLVGWDGIVKSYWDGPTRTILLALNLFGTAVFAVVNTVVYRQDVRGIPPATVDAAGVRIGAVLIPWSQIQGIGPFKVGSNGYLELIVAKDAAASVPLIDRILWRRRDASDLTRVVVSERQVGCSIEAAQAHVLAFQPREPGAYPLLSR
jgi:hypothetical protein